MDVGRGGHGPPWIFTHTLLNLPNFKNSIFSINTGFIFIGPPLKNFLTTPMYRTLEFYCKFAIMRQTTGGKFVIYIFIV